MVLHLRQLDPEQASLQPRRHLLLLDLDRESEVPPEGSNPPLTHDHIRRLVGALLGLRRDLALPAKHRHQRKRIFGFSHVLWARDATADGQVARAGPLAVDVDGVFDARTFDVDQVVADGVADVAVGVVGEVPLVGLSAGQPLEIGLVLVLAGVSVVHD